MVLCLPQLATAYGDAITRLFEARVRPTEYDLIVTRMASASFASNDLFLVPHGLPRSDGGFFLEPPRLPEHADIDVVRNAVIIGVCPESGLDAFDYVRIDLSVAAAAAVRCILKRRPRRFAFMTASDVGVAHGESRYNAYVQGVCEASLQPIFIVMARTSDLMTDAQESFLKFVANAECPDAVMCTNDEIAIGVLRALRQIGKNVPGDVSVVGCDGIDFAQDSRPALATIAQPFREMADIAWEFMAARLADSGSPPQHAVLDARFIERESVFQ
jgi:DNA-binding LacI/PurR family transcriptional regulator